ncbi:1-pyrroline-5-carboxylate dehydrogenase 1 [Anatilimnocola aggregata]|uniref:L-glutamate gamma-semialdehyde dehydrogenase n=1 Tax=Anatilimnocola aggregata TaxID=2528021 RepID=A0A517YEU8_9BACT|nr:bifunctional proline dehydrogenase/L-glutamate gamma-semialdehyde dehydrogenase [Anatilimnocola aggregata]QDU28765.1 1-pyrroline-5-carboxylate dehydrogenase 1 [Anatilimnocola aggregata]
MRFSFADAALIDSAVQLAAALQQRATELQSPAERKQQAELDRMLRHPADKATLVQLTDQAFRSHAAARTAEQFTHILDVQGIPRFFSPLDQALLRGFQTFGGWLPTVTVPLVKAHLQHETANVVLPAEPEVLREHLAARREQGVRMNLNFLGESLLGEEEATHRLNKYLEALQTPEVEVLSVKISTLYSQILPIARKHTLQQLCDRMELLYRQSTKSRYLRLDGTEVPKFVYLDMEEYRDLTLTAATFMRTLSRPGLEHISAGIALQAYIPDSFAMQKRITFWARDRVARGGAPVTIRIVKGANMEMERIDAALHDWPAAPFQIKAQTDANYKQMLRYALRPENLSAVRVGIASHNLFDVAYGLVLSAKTEAGDRVQFEMLEGMANHQRRALLERTQQLLLYAPACRKEEFLNAIGYLIRRLDENTGPENFLGHAFRLKVGSDDWRMLEQSFRSSFHMPLSSRPHRSQNRQEQETDEAFLQPKQEIRWNEFDNEPDTDWSLPANAKWAQRIVRTDDSELELTTLPIVVAGQEIIDRESKHCLNPSRPGKAVCTYTLANEGDVNSAVECAKQDRAGWRSLSVAERNQMLGRAAAELRRSRATLMHTALVNGGKIITESDPEVSEAVDFVEFYRASARRWFELESVQATPCGVVVVVPPWNFPIAIPCGGVAAALAAGNTVILKPASDTVLVAWELCQCFWRAGISRKTLQFLPCPGSGPGSQLVSHPDVAAVILTGGTDTALRMLAKKPDLRLSAETGGKNATIVTSLSDRELAIKHVVQSAFGHGGQKCSATSLLLLDAEIYDDAQFKRMLCDAVESLHVGSAYELHSRVGPLIHAPAGALEEALKTLEPGETWAVMPRRVGDNPNLWSPGVKYGVLRGSITHRTEFFGPLLGVMRFESLDEALELVNETGYGLTSAIHSLDDREIDLWKAGIRAGNLYINRGTTGAIVLRQPFGGMGASAVGPGLKAGGPNYVAAFLDFVDRDSAVATAEAPLHNSNLADLLHKLDPRQADNRRLRRAIASYDYAWQHEFAREHDHFRLLGQDNIRRYLPLTEVCVRVVTGDTRFDVLARIAASRVTGARVVVSLAPECEEEWSEQLDRLTESWAAGIETLTETDDDLIRNLEQVPDVRLRYSCRERVPLAVRQAAAQVGRWIADVPVVSEGLIELLWYVREQSISYDYHRYGNLGTRAAEPRRALLGSDTVLPPIGERRID